MTAEGSRIQLLDLTGSDESYDSTKMVDARSGSRDGMRAHLALGENEAELLRLVALNDVEGVEQLLQKHPDTDVNAQNLRGECALQLGVECHSARMVALLLAQPRVRMRDAQLHAVREGQREILVMLLDWQEEQRVRGLVQIPHESAEFPCHMTPLMLACICNEHALVHLLIQRGHVIQLPDPDSYKESEYADYGETLELGRMRIDTYRALASPAHMCLVHSDPVLAAFTLSSKADQLATTDPIFNKEYGELSAQCREFAVSLLAQCRTSEEVWVMLQQSHDPESRDHRVGDSPPPPRGKYPRLTLAAQYEQKEFLTHAHCQKVLQNLWSHDNAQVQTMTTPRKLLYFLPRMLIAPFAYILYFFAPCLPFLQYWEAPMCKFMGDVISYVMYLSLLIASVVLGGERSGVRVPNLYSGIDIAIWFWISSFLLEEIRTLLSRGLAAYSESRWLLLRAVTTSLFVISFLLRFINVIAASERGEEFRNLERRFWPWYDPMLLSEAFYCLATVLACARTLQLFTVSALLGPLQISLGRMLSDILQMFAILAIVMFAFASGLTRLYHYYSGSAQVDEQGEVTYQEEAFTSWRSSFRTLFWGMFGYGDTAYTDVIVDNTCSPDNVTHACHDVITHDVTEAAGSLLYALYHVIMLLTLLNMLIGLMSNTLAAIQENSDAEWKFARSLVWLHYIERDHVLPHPLTALPSVTSLMTLVHWVKVKCGRVEHAQAGCSCADCCYVETGKDLEREEKLKETYQYILKRLVVRHTHQMAAEESAQALSDKHLQQVRRMLSERLATIKTQVAELAELREQQAESDGRSASVKLRVSAPGASLKSRDSAWSGVTDTELGDNII